MLVKSNGKLVLLVAYCEAQMHIAIRDTTRVGKLRVKARKRSAKAQRLGVKVFYRTLPRTPADGNNNVAATFTIFT